MVQHSHSPRPLSHLSPPEENAMSAPMSPSPLGAPACSLNPGGNRCQMPEVTASRPAGVNSASWTKSYTQA